MTQATPAHTHSPNRLIESTSPYLLQHAHNPVDWYPFGPEAIERARVEDKPIFLSIGYSACHWCHVMEHEVFENADIAAQMNANFINIKVDREERPDLDELYMMATQLMTGQGGWPMSVWMTPQLEPFYAGTYFPPEDGYGRPGFPRLLSALSDAWRNNRGELVAQAQKVVEAARHRTDETLREGAGAPIDLAKALGEAVEQSADSFDSEFGGMGSAPKFPPHQSLALWVALLRHPRHLSATHVAALREMTSKTLDGMMLGGLYDHVGGGFARYSTDAQWLVPHFEKMLYDNAQLAAAYAAAAVQFGRSDYARVARHTLDFCLREMASAERSGGGFFSSLDADSEGIEGKFYVWTLAQVREAVVNEDDAKLIIAHFGITEAGNWEEGHAAWGAGANVLHIERRVDDLAREFQMPPEGITKRIDRIVAQMRAYRAKRIGPGRDDKVLTSWNGLMISALAICGRLLREPRYLEAAHRAIGYVLLNHMDRGRHLMRVSRTIGEDIRAHTPAFLEDHAFLLSGLVDLIEATQPTSLPGTMARKRALELADTMVREFYDAENGGFFFTSKRHEALFAPVKNISDGATPNANAVAIRALLRLAQVSGRETYREMALKSASAFSAIVARGPSVVPTMLHALLLDQEYLASNPHLNMPADVEMGIPLGVGAIEDVPEPVASPAPHILSLEPVTLPALRAGQTFDLALVLRIAAGYHIQTARPGDKEAFATVARIRGDLPIAAQEWSYPDSVSDPHSYATSVTITGRLTVHHNAAAGAYSLRAIVLAQPCSQQGCLPPEKATLDIPVRVAV